MYRNLAVVAALAVASTAVLVPSGHAGDPVEPALTASYHPSYMNGARLSPHASAEIVDTNFGMLTWPAKLRFRSAGGTTTVQSLRVSDEPTTIAQFRATKGSVTVGLRNYDGEQGGDTQRVTGWQLTNDGAGAQSGWVTSAGSAIIDTDGEVQASGEVGLIGAQSYTGDWVHRADAELPSGVFLGRTSARSETPGDAMSMDVEVDRGAQFGVIMRKSPAGGKVALYRDGQFVREIDLRAERVSTQVVTHVQLSAGAHTLSIENSSTSDSHDRVLLDAMLLAGGYVSASVLPGPGFAS